MIELRPLTRDAANELVRRWHRHHKPVRAHRFAIGAFVAGAAVGAVIVGNPKARHLDDGLTFEVVRLVTNGERHAASRLLGAAWRCARAMGVKRMISYTRQDEHGTCYRAAGWREVAMTRAECWDNGGNAVGPYLPGLFTPATETVQRVRWEVAA